MNYLRKSKHKWMIPAYGIFYMAAFMFVERSDVKIHILHSFADDMIPFCKYFIIPYVMWYFFLIGTILYFALACESKKEYYQYLGTLGIGMTLFLLISWIYPNGQDLRPELVGNDIFTNTIRFLYRIDTPTNIFPSMHVFNAAASCIALYHNKKARSSKLFTAFNLTLTVSIILSTMFLKQHSVADVATALILNFLCYFVFYRFIPENQARMDEVFTAKEMFTIPNLLSTVRIGVACVFLGMVERNGLNEEIRNILAVLIVIAMVTDILDSLFANELHQTSRVGRLLDPLANKAMQGVILVALAHRFELAEYVLVLFAIKELYMVIAGWRAVKEADFSLEPQWHGKLNTSVTFVVGFLLLAADRVTYSMASALIGACALYMFLSFILYAESFRETLESRAYMRRRKMERRRANWIQ